MEKEKFIKLTFINSVFISIALILTVIIFAVFFMKDAKKDFGRSKADLLSGAQSTPPILPKQKEIILPKVLYNLSGKITKIENGAIIFNAEIISIGSDKKIVKTIESRKAITSASTKFNKLAFVSNSPVETKIEIKDLKEGDYIEAISDKDISKSIEFTATQVRILP